MRRERSGGGCDGSSGLFSTVRVVALCVMGVDFSGRRLGAAASRARPLRARETLEITGHRSTGNQGTRAKHKAHGSSRVLLPGLFNHRGIGWLVACSHAPWNVRLGLRLVLVFIFVSWAVKLNLKLLIP